MTVLEGTVDIPAVGKTKKTYLAVGVALVAGIVGFAYYRRMQGASAAADPNSFYADTRTGSDLPTDQYVNPDPTAGDLTGSAGWKAPTTDQEWAQQAIDKLSWYENGYTSATVGKYLARQPLTADEQTLIREAWAQIGHPPGNQPIIPATTGTPAVGGAAANDIKIVDLRMTGNAQTRISMDWGVIGRPDLYRVFVNGVKKAEVSSSQTTIGGLSKGTKYTVGVAPVRSNVQGPTVFATASTKK